MAGLRPLCAARAPQSGYISASNLHRAARDGRLKTMTIGPLNTRVTTPQWLDEYLASLRLNTQFRGKPRRGQDGTPPTE
ncbi:MAG TPA: hypothetical protein VKF37_14545 [Chloroflexota bacterium]|nr:hypothetical protein [Chloroflexota bacterium]